MNNDLEDISDALTDALAFEWPESLANEKEQVRLALAKVDELYEQSK